jgi:hypothetical protein
MQHTQLLTFAFFAIVQKKWELRQGERASRPE